MASGPRTEMAQDDERLGIKSVEIAATILRAVADGGGLLQLREISKATEMQRGKVHRYLTSLTRSRMLYQDDDTGAYGIGRLAISLGLAGLQRIDPVRIAYRELPKLSDLAHETAAILIWGDMGPTVIALQESPRPVALNLRAGSILPLRYSAAGQVFEAFLPAETIAAVSGDENPHEDSGKVPQGDSLEDVRRQGIGRSAGHVLPGVNALAAPVFDHTGKLSLVIGLVGRKETLIIDWDSEAASQLRDFTKHISQELGYG